MYSILLADAHSYTRNLLKEISHQVFEHARIEEADSLYKARELITQKKYCLAFIDASFPDGSGIEIVKKIVLANSQTYIVMTSMHDDDKYLFDSLRAGAKGYLLKDLSKEQLTHHIKGILFGKPPISDRILRRLLDYFHNPTLTNIHPLTARETEVLCLIGKGWSRREVSNSLEISVNTAAEHIQNIYQKLNINTRAEAALEACRLGLISVQ